MVSVAAQGMLCAGTRQEPGQRIRELAPGGENTQLE